MVIKIPNTFIHATSLLSLILYFLITATSNPNSVLADEVIDEEDPEFYILDETPLISNVTVSSKTRLLLSHYKEIKKGMKCDVASYKICNGVKANNGTSLLHCCKKHCRNILGDMNNCGRCGHKCGFGQRCCSGVCTYVNFNSNHCGKCKRKCNTVVNCEYGICGYA